MRIIVSSIVGLALLSGISGCSSPVGPTYQASDANRGASVQMGTVVSVSPVVLEGEVGTLGKLIGGVAGAAVGSTIGKGNGSVLAAAAGGVGGAVAGDAIDKKSSKKQGYRVVVKKDSGEQVSVVQKSNNVSVGQRVELSVLSNGKIHIQ